METSEIIALFESRQKANMPLPEHKLAELGPQAVGPLLDEFAREWRRCGEHRRRHHATTRMFIIEAFVFVAFISLGLFHVHPEILLLLGMLLLGAFFVAGVWGDPKGVLEFKDDRTHAVMTAVMCVLRRWGICDSGHLTRDQRTALCCVLGSCCLASSVYYDAMVAAAILRELAAIGDGQALPLVQVLAGPSAVDEVHPVVYRAANQCLPPLYQRSLQEGAWATLLRPAPVPQDAAAILLRPARNASETDPHALLRSGPIDRE